MSNISIFKGFTATIPSYVDTDLDSWQVFSLMAGDLQIECEKKQVRYTTPITFRRAPYTGKTALWKNKLGETQGIQRSATHAEGCIAKHVLFDFDEIPLRHKEQVFDWLNDSNVQYFAYSSHSHGKPEVKGHSFRLAVFLDNYVNGINDYVTVWRGIAYSHFEGFADDSSSKPYQLQGCWATAPERVDKAWCTKNISKGVALSTDKYLALGAQVVASSPFGSAGIIGRAELTVMTDDSSVSAGMMVPLKETPQQREIYEALCMLDSASTELLIRVYGCLKAIGDEYQGHFENWVYSKPEAVEKYRAKHPTKYDPRHMWTKNGWAPSITKDKGFATVKNLARASAWQILESNDAASDEAEISWAYLNKYHSRWLENMLGNKTKSGNTEMPSHDNC